MTSTKPYQTPRSNVIDPASIQYADTEIFSTTQRLGRLRWFVYNFVASFVMMIFIGIIAAIAIPVLNTGNITGEPDSQALIFIFILYLAPLTISLILARRRLHDLNKSGWLSLLFIVPLINIILGLYLMFAPGTMGNNNYGSKPEPYTAFTWVVGLIVPIFMFGILAAVAIPNSYVEQAKAAAQIQVQP